MNDPYGNNEDPEAPLWERYENGGPADKLEALTSLGDIQTFKQEWADALIMYEEAHEIAVSLDRQFNRYELLARIARCQSRLGEPDRALALLRDNEKEVRAHLESGELSSFYRTKGFVYQDLRLALEALDCFRASEALSREADDWGGICLDVASQVRMLSILQDHTAAVELLDRVIPEAEENAYIGSVVHLMHSRAKLHIDMREYGAAAEIMSEALLIDEQAPWEDSRIAMEMTLATALVHLGDRAEAMIILDETDRHIRFANSRNKVKSAMLRGQIVDGDEGATLRAKARARARRDGMHQLGNICDINDAMRLATEGNLTGAERLIRGAMRDADEHGDTHLVHEARIRLAAVLVEARRPDEALAVLSDLTEAHFGDDMFLAWRFRTVLGSALVDVGDLDAAVNAVSPVFAAAPTLEHYRFLADAHYVLARVAERRDGRDARWAEHLGKSVAYLHRVGDVGNAEQRAAEFLDDDANHPERILDQDEALRALDDRNASEASDE